MPLRGIVGRHVMRRIEPNMSSSQKNSLCLPLPRTAVFIDGDWLWHAAKSVGARSDYPMLAEYMADAFGRWTSIWLYMSVAGDSQSPSMNIEAPQTPLFKMKVIPTMKSGHAGSSKIDEIMAADIASLPAKYDRLVLISGDSGFAPVVSQARQVKRSTIVIAFPLVAGRALVECADRFVSLEALLDSMVRKGLQGNLTPATQKVRNEYYFERGAHLEPYLIIRKLFAEARARVLVVDSYLDEQILLTLQMLPVNVAVKLLTDRLPADFCTMVMKLRREGRNIEIRQTKEFHDRFLLVDDILWHSGHSFKDLGNKDSRLSKVTDMDARDKLKKRVAEVLKTSKSMCL